LLGDKAVIVERVDSIGDVDVVAAKTGRRLDPSDMESEIRVAFEKREGQHLAGAVGKEMPVGPVPAAERIVLYVDFREEHRRS